MTIGPRLLRALLELVRSEGGGTVHWWVHEPTPVHDEIAAGVGMRPDRDLLQLRVPLPLPAEERPPLEWRPFVPGQDEQAWLDVNNRAFDTHPEQGGWSLDDILAHEKEPWFDPAGFLVHEEDGRMAGFLWTKIHRDEEPALGEVYVVGVHPDFGGRGLGRALTVAAMDWVHRERGITTGMLYVDADNTTAMRLYDRLGFTRHSTDRAYACEVVGPDGGDSAGVGVDE
jgi:mycothiol synthase